MTSTSRRSVLVEVTLLWYKTFMPNLNNIAYASELLQTRPDLEFESPISAFIGDNPTPMRLTEAALAIAQSGVLPAYIDAVVQDPTGTTFEENPPFMLVSDDRKGGCVESLHALTIAKGDQWDARLHVWMEGRRLTEDLHTHRSAFGSVVLAGAFGDEVFVRTKPGEGTPMVEWRYDQLEPLGEVAMRSLRHRRFTAGQHHTMPHTMIHSAQVRPEGLSATVVVRRLRDHTSFGYTDGPRAVTFPRIEQVDGADTLRRLRTALDDA